MDKSDKYSCAREVGAEVAMVIITFIIATSTLYSLIRKIFLLSKISLYKMLGFPVSKTKTYRKLSDKNEGILLSAAFTLFLPLTSFQFSQAQQNNSDGRAEVILVWMVLTEYIHVRDGNSTWEIKKSADQLMRLIWIIFLIFSYNPQYWFIFFALCAVSFIYEVLKGIVDHKAKDSYLIGRNPKLIHNYMKKVMLHDDMRTTPMNKCDYIVMGEENHDISTCSDGYCLSEKKSNSVGKLTIGRVFQLNSSKDEAFTMAHPDWRNKCLSIALAKILRRRFVNLPLDEAGNRKALEFVLEGLIDYVGSNEDIPIKRRNQERNPIERVFDIVQDELSIAWLLWTSCLYIQYKGMIGSISNYWPILKLNNVIKRYIQNPAKWNKSNSSVAANKSPKLHAQFSNMSSYEKNVEQGRYHSILDSKEGITFCIKIHGTTTFFLVKLIERKIRRAFPTLLNSDVKEALLRSLRKSGGQITNGETTLRSHGVLENMNWVCQPSMSTAEAILIWHIATTLFHYQKPMSQTNNNPFKNYTKVISILIKYRLITKTLFQQPPPQQNTNPFKKEGHVALALSTYCYYLVVSLPQLLPDEVEWTKNMYESAKEEIFAIDHSSRQKPTIKNRCSHLMGDVQLDEKSMVGKGVKLAKMLVLYADNGKEVWTMLSEFWAEMLLFIAPSDNVKGHEEILEKEELITQLWALLTHAGILTRPQPTQPTNHGSESDEVIEIEADTLYLNHKSQSNATIEVVTDILYPSNASESNEINEV